jgi:FkbM family methyltransferase
MITFFRTILAFFFARLRIIQGGRLPVFFLRYPNRTCQLLPPQVRGDFLPGIPMIFDLRDQMQRYLYLEGLYYETPDINLISSRCQKPGTLFLDIGANIGIYSFSVLYRNPEAQIFAFEPNPKTFAKIQETKNLGHYPNLHLIPLALSNGRAQTALHASDTNSGWSTLGTHPPTGESHEVLVSQIPFDEWWQEQSEATRSMQNFVIKIDVEGFETRVVQGMSGFLSQHQIAFLLIEFYDTTLENAGTSAAELFETLTRLGLIGSSDPNFSSTLSAAPICAQPTNLYFKRLSPAV